MPITTNATNTKAITATLNEKQLSDSGRSARAIAGDGFTYRHDWGQHRGLLLLTLNWSGFTGATRVFVAAAEGGGLGGKFVGDALYTVHNVAPGVGSVTIRLNVEWDSPIGVVVDYLIIEP